MLDVPGKKRKSAQATVCVASSRKRSIAEAIADLKAHLGTESFAHILIFFSATFAPKELAQSLAQAFPEASISGCSAAGGIDLAGFVDDGIVAIGFRAAHFHVASGLIENISEIGFANIYQATLALRTRLAEAMPAWRPEKLFGLMFVDGVSNREEKIVAAVRAAIHDFPIVGASAGDGLRFDSTSLIWNGHVARDAAIVVLFETDCEFRPFRTQSFEPKDDKLVVTAANVEHRIVYELNAEPAALEYGRVIGLDPEALSPMTFASHPVVVKVGTEIYCRSIRQANEDGSLTFYSAIDEGMVLTVAEPKNLVAATREMLDGIRGELGEIAAAIGFECVLRKLEGQAVQELQALEDIYRDHRLVGFHTYGEQFNAMHLNQTLTGIAIGTNVR